MKSLWVVLAALALVGCSVETSRSSYTVAVTGTPDEVARFVAAEEARSGDVQVTHSTGATRAVFSVPTSEAQTEIRLRAATARLAAETRDVDWSISSGSQASVAD